MATEGMGCTQQITMGFDLHSLRKNLLQERNHDRLLFRTDTTAIKTDTFDRIGIQPLKEFTTQDVSDENPILVKGINALGLETHPCARSRLQGPVGLRTSTICYQYHAAKVHFFLDIRT